MNNKNIKISKYETFDIEGLIKRKVRNFRKLKERTLPLRSFKGGGIYALYYKGENKIYGSLNNKRVSQPIYIGRTNPNVNISNQTKKKISSNLYQKIKEQIRSIETAKNLRIADFTCKCMILNTKEQMLSEAIEAKLISKHLPAWNICIEGFSNHNPGKSRIKQSPSEWDILHPGRNWVNKLKGRPKSKKYIEHKVKKYLEKI